MTRIDFYGLTEVRREARERFAVRLAARAFREGHRSVLLGVDEAMCQRLQTLLWSDTTAFLPHINLADTGPEAATVPIALATPSELAAAAARTPAPAELLVNLTDSVPERFAAFERVAEIVCEDEDVRAAGRVSYRFYRERGYPLKYHDLGRGRAG